MTLIQQPTQLTKADIILTKVSALHSMINITHKKIFNDIWRDENPQAIINQIGYEKAVALFSLSGALQDILAGADPLYVRLIPDRTVEFTTDSVIIGDLPIVEEVV